MQRVVALVAIALIVPLTFAQTYPSKPVRIMVPFPTGGTADILARIAGAELSKALGQPFTIENRAGGGGNIGADVIAKSAPDGYNLLMATNAIITINPTIAEQGFPGYEAFAWFGLLAPTSTPPAIVERINAEITRAMSTPAMRENLAKQGADVLTGSSAAFANFLRQDFAKWGRVVEASGATLD